MTDTQGEQHTTKGMFVCSKTISNLTFEFRQQIN